MYTMNKMIGLSKKERTPLIYNPVTKQSFDGIKHFTTTKAEINEWSVTKSYTSPYIHIKQEKDKSLEETYNYFIKQADKLKTHHVEESICIKVVRYKKQVWLSFFIWQINRRLCQRN